jgi:hypothetical protein
MIKKFNMILILNMGIISSVKTGGLLAVYIPCILLIMCFYLYWIASYSYDNEFMLGTMLVILGMLYISAIYMITTNHYISAACVVLTSLIIIISIAITSKFRQKNGSQGFSFVCLGLIPMMSGICFVSVSIGLLLPLLQSELVSGPTGMIL